MNKNTNNLLFLGITILVIGLFLLSYSISSYKEVKDLSNKVDFDELENNTQMSGSEKYFKYLSIADYLNQHLNKNKNLAIKNTSCVYLDYAQHNAILLYKLTYSGLQTEESRKSVAAGNIRSLFSMLDNYATCKQAPAYKAELKNLLEDIQKSDVLYSNREERMQSFMNGYDTTYAIKGNPQQSADETSQTLTPEAGIAPDEGAYSQPVQNSIPAQSSYTQQNTYSQQAQTPTGTQSSNYQQNSAGY